MPTFAKILIANRGEIAIRVMRAANEMGKRTVAVFAEEDKLSLHRFKADEAYRIGEGLGPVAAYLSIPEIIRVAKMSGADAIHPGYGLLSENPDFVDACEAAGITFIGPTAETMRMLGDKASARKVAIAAGVPVIPRDRGPPRRHGRSAPHGRRRRLPLHAQGELGRRRPRHAPDHDPRRARGEGARRPARGPERLRQRRGLPREDDRQRPPRRGADHRRQDGHHLPPLGARLLRPAPQPEGRRARPRPLPHPGAARPRLLPRPQDRPRRQLRVRRHRRVPHRPRLGRLLLHRGEPARPGRAHRHRGGHRHRHRPRPDPDRGRRDHRRGRPARPSQADITLNGHAIQCRITTEDPQNNFIPDYGRITAYRGATGHGIRLDGGTAYSGAVITRYYDSLLEKVTAWAPTPEMAIARLDRALREFRIRGVSTNIAFVENLLKHPTFLDYSYTTRFIDTTPELFHFTARRDRATKILTYIADVTVNGHPETAGRPTPPAEARARNRRWFRSTPRRPARAAAPGDPGRPGGRRLDAGAGEAPRHRHHHARRAPEPPRHADALLRHDPGGRPPTPACSRSSSASKCWGGATFDVAYRFLQECPWQRLRDLRAAMPNLMTQMLLRASNGVGYTNYPDNVVADLRRPGGRVRRRRLPRLRLAQLGREHARRHGRRHRDRQDLRGGDLLHRRHPRPRPRQVRPEILRRHGQGAARRRRPRPRPQGHGRAPQALGRLRAGQGAEGGGRPPHPLPHPRHQRHRRRQHPRRLARRGRRGRRRHGQLLRQHLPALPRARSSRRWRAPSATPSSTSTPSASSPTTGRPSAPSTPPSRPA